MRWLAPGQEIASLVQLRWHLRPLAHGDRLEGEPPEDRQGLSRRKGAGRTALRKKDDKHRDTRSFKETHEAHECEDAPEDSDGENVDDLSPEEVRM